MTWTETRKNINTVKIEVEKAFSLRYKEIKSPKIYHTGKLFHTDGYGDISVCIMGDEAPWDFLVIEYDNGEDGDGFYPSDYDSLDSLVNDMITEIEDK